MEASSIDVKQNEVSVALPLKSEPFVLCLNTPSVTHILLLKLLRCLHAMPMGRQIQYSF